MSFYIFQDSSYTEDVKGDSTSMRDSSRPEPSPGSVGSRSNTPASLSGTFYLSISCSSSKLNKTIKDTIMYKVLQSGLDTIMNKKFMFWRFFYKLNCLCAEALKCLKNHLLLRLKSPVLWLDPYCKNLFSCLPYIVAIKF